MSTCKCVGSRQKFTDNIEFRMKENRNECRKSRRPQKSQKYSFFFLSIHSPIQLFGYEFANCSFTWLTQLNEQAFAHTISLCNVCGANTKRRNEVWVRTKRNMNRFHLQRMNEQTYSPDRDGVAEQIAAFAFAYVLNSIRDDVIVN